MSRRAVQTCVLTRSGSAAAVMLMLGVPARLPVATKAANANPAITGTQAATANPLAGANMAANDGQTAVISPRPRQWVAWALQHNRDLRAAALNVQCAGPAGPG